MENLLKQLVLGSMWVISDPKRAAQQIRSHFFAYGGDATTQVICHYGDNLLQEIEKVLAGLDK